MKRLLCKKLPRPRNPVQLEDSEANHAINVLRLRSGEQVEALDGSGKSVTAVLNRRDGSVWLEFVQGTSESERPKAALPLTLEMSVLKADAMEWTLEKAVELGVRTFIPVLTAHTVVQLDKKGPEFFQERWQKIADQALKQCGRLERMEIQPPIPLENLLNKPGNKNGSVRLYFDESARIESEYLLDWLTPNAASLASIQLLVGPEGGWSDQERVLLNESAKRDSAYRLSLGPWVLRAETAAIFAVSLATAFFRSKTKA